MILYVIDWTNNWLKHVWGSNGKFEILINCAYFEGIIHTCYYVCSCHFGLMGSNIYIVHAREKSEKTFSGERCRKIKVWILLYVYGNGCFRPFRIFPSVDISPTAVRQKKAISKARSRRKNVNVAMLLFFIAISPYFYYNVILCLTYLWYFLLYCRYLAFWAIQRQYYKRRDCDHKKKTR